MNTGAEVFPTLNSFICHFFDEAPLFDVEIGLWGDRLFLEYIHACGDNQYPRLLGSQGSIVLHGGSLWAVEHVWWEGEAMIKLVRV